VGVVLAAVYLLWMYQRVFLGVITNDKNKTLPDCSALEKLILATVVIVILAMGIYPQPFLRRMDHSVSAVMSRVQGTGNREQGLGIREQGTGNRAVAVATFDLPAGRRVPNVRALSLSPHTLSAPPCSVFRPVPYPLFSVPPLFGPVPYSLPHVPSAGGGK
jgi:hypothetical protein